jgi:hypothetical protein
MLPASLTLHAADNLLDTLPRHALRDADHSEQKRRLAREVLSNTVGRWHQHICICSRRRISATVVSASRIRLRATWRNMWKSRQVTGRQQAGLVLLPDSRPCDRMLTKFYVNLMSLSLT